MVSRKVIALVSLEAMHNAHGKSLALEGRRVCSKSPSRVRDGDERVAGRNGREKYFPDKESLICPPGKSMNYHKKETEKIELVARPAGFFSSVEEAKDVLNDRRRREMFSYPTFCLPVSL